MAFLNKFTSKGTNPPPAGIDMKNTSWGVVQPGSYTPNLVTQNNQQKPGFITFACIQTYM